jgi:hypothetical protein
MVWAGDLCLSKLIAILCLQQSKGKKGGIKYQILGYIYYTILIKAYHFYA